MRIAASAMEHKEFVSGAVSEMLAEGVATRLPPGEKPIVVSPLGVVPNEAREQQVPAYNQHEICQPAFREESL